MASSRTKRLAPIQFTPGSVPLSTHRLADDGQSARHRGCRRVPPKHLGLEAREAWLAGWDNADRRDDDDDA